MGQLLLVLLVAVTVAAVVFGVTTLISGRDPGLVPAEADGRAVPLPGDRPLRESDVGEVRFDTAVRGYRMAQVDQALRRAAYDIGYKTELIGVLEAEVAALRQGRTAEADALQRAREQSAGRATAPPDPTTEPVIELGTPAEPASTTTEPFVPTAEPAVVGAAAAAGAGSAAGGGASPAATPAGDPTPESGTEFGADQAGEETTAPPAPASGTSSAPASGDAPATTVGAEPAGEVESVDGAAGARGEASTDESDATAVRTESK